MSPARPEGLHTFDFSTDKNAADSCHDGIATGHDRSRQDMSILRISEPGELARTSFVRSKWNGFHTKERKNLRGLLSAAGELALHDRPDLSLVILRDDERVFPAKRG